MRAVCDALRLDSAVEEEVLELRHNLLRLTHTREFAQAAQFKVLPGARGCSALVCFSFTLLYLNSTHICSFRHQVPELSGAGLQQLGRCFIVLRTFRERGPSCRSCKVLGGLGDSIYVRGPHVQEPCRSYVLRDVICVYCNHCTDLDLCRDPALQVRSQCHASRPSLAWMLMCSHSTPPV